MAQVTKFTIDPNLSGIQLRTQASEMLTALSTLNSGDLEPANPSAGMLWLDTTKNILKIRDKTNTVWLDFANVNDKVLAVNAASATDSLKLGGLAADKFAKKDDIPAVPQAATEAKAGIVKIKKQIGNTPTDDVVPTEKAVADALAKGFSNSKQQNGYTKLLNGIMLQWGRVKDLEQDARKNLTFPISFPNACLNASATYIADSSFSQAGGVMYVANITKTGMTIEYQTVDNDASNFPKRDAFWFAIGY